MADEHAGPDTRLPGRTVLDHVGNGDASLGVDRAGGRLFGERHRIESERVVYSNAAPVRRTIGHNFVSGHSQLGKYDLGCR